MYLRPSNPELLSGDTPKRPILLTILVATNKVLALVALPEG